MAAKPAKISFWKTIGLICLVLLLFDHPNNAVSGSDIRGSQLNSYYHVGYRILDFEYRDGEAEKSLTAAVWYPTSQRPEEYQYGGPTRGKVAVDAKPDAGGGPYPLLVFSHGYGGGGLGSVFFTERLAARGWIVVAPDHHDRHSAVRIRSGQKKDFDRRGLIRHARKISRSGPEDRDAYLYRLNELEAVLDGILQSEVFEKRIDKNKIAVGGHSFGGFTALGLCGTIDARHDDRIRAVLLFSTGAGGYLFTADELAAVKMPSMTFLGEREKNKKRGAATMAELADKVYRNMIPPKYLLEVKGASHFSFSNRFSNRLAARYLSGTENQYEVIRRYAIAFLEMHVAGRMGTNSVLEKKDAMLTRYEREPETGNPQSKHDGADQQ